MSSTLLTNGYVVTVDGGRAVHPSGFVHVEGERIAAQAMVARMAAVAKRDE